MYYIIVPQELCERRKVFTQNMRLPDGRVVLTLRDLAMTRFSYGQVEIVNGDDLKLLASATAQAAPSADAAEGKEGQGA